MSGERARGRSCRRVEGRVRAGPESVWQRVSPKEVHLSSNVSWSQNIPDSLRESACSAWNLFACKIVLWGVGRPSRVRWRREVLFVRAGFTADASTWPAPRTTSATLVFGWCGRARRETSLSETSGAPCRPLSTTASSSFSHDRLLITVHGDIPSDFFQVRALKLRLIGQLD